MMYCLDLKLIHIIHWICTESEKITLNNSVDSLFPFKCIRRGSWIYYYFFFFRFFVLVQGNVVFSDKYISKIIIFTQKKDNSKLEYNMTRLEFITLKKAKYCSG